MRRSDIPVGTKCIEALQLLQKEYAWAIDLEICAFAQEGLANKPEADKALVQALEMGGHVDRRRAELRHRSRFPHQPCVRAGAGVRHPRRYAHRFRSRSGVDGQTCWGCRPHREIQIRRPRCHGPYDEGRRVAAAQQKDIAKRLADVGAAVTVLPATDLIVLARHRDYDVPRCITDANLFAEQGCNWLDFDQQYPQSLHPIRRTARSSAWPTCMPTFCKWDSRTGSPNCFHDQRPLCPPDQCEGLWDQSGQSR